MKLPNYVFLSLLITLVFICSCASIDSDKTTQNSTNGLYKDGVYSNSLEKDYEGYETTAITKVENGKIVSIDWKIYDTNNKRFFDSTYEEVFKGNDTYIQQCRDNMVGVRKFGPQLLQTQDIDKVDAITGATWCYNKFKEVAKKALVEAKK